MPAWDRPDRTRAVRAALLVAAGLGGSVAAAGAQETSLGGALELVDPDVLRVCADPRNLPFSNEAGEGFENEIARLLADSLGRSVTYTFFPQGVGFIRNTLAANRCDVIIGYAQGGELVQGTNPYYRTAYAIAYSEGSPLEGIDSLADPRLEGLTIGVVAGTPPATTLARRGLIGAARPYHLMVDTRVESPVADMLHDLEAGEIDAALAWGPMAGYHARQSATAMTVVPLTREEGGPRMSYRITMGVRPSDQEWKRTLNAFIREHQDELNAILLRYGVPLLDESDQPITQAAR